MHEETLRKYFLDQIDIYDLTDALTGSSVRFTSKVTHYEIQDMSEDFEVYPRYIVKLVKDLIKFNLDLCCLQQVAFILISSDNFHWKLDNKQSDEMDAILNEWCTPEINYALNIDNVQKCLKRLES